MAKKTSNTQKGSSSTPYKVKPRASQGAGPPQPGTDYTNAEWKKIIKEWISLEDQIREKGAPSLTTARNELCEYYQRSYFTITGKGRALGLIAPSVSRMPMKSGSSRTIPPPPATANMNKERRELYALRKIVKKAIEDGTISGDDVLNIVVLD